MATEEEINELTNRFLNGDLSPEEEQQLKERCETDPDFKEQMSLQSNMEAAIKSTAREALKERLDKRYEAALEKKRRKVKRLYRNLSVAATLLILMGLGYWYFSPPSMQALYAQYFEVKSIGYRGDSFENKVHQEKYDKAVSLYNSKNYKQAAEILKTLSLKQDLGEGASQVHYHLGICYMEDQTKEAIRQFSQVDTGSTLFQRAFWYTGLAYLKQKEKEKAIKAFEQLVQSPIHTFKKKEAEEILEALK